MKNIQKNIIKTIILFLGIMQFSCADKAIENKGNSTEKPSETSKQIAQKEKEIPHLVEISEKQFQTSNTTLGTTQMRNMSSTLKVNGMLDVPPQNIVSVSAIMGGFVRKTDLLQGMKVGRGQLLALIENPDFIQIQQDYLEGKAKIEYLLQEYKRQNELSKENTGALKVFQQVASELKMLQARQNGLEMRMQTIGINKYQVDAGKITSTIGIYSPISGYVTTINVNVGKYVNMSDVLFEIVDTEHLHAELTVFEKDFHKVKEGQKIRFVLSNETEERTAKVYLINRKINEDRTVRVHAHIDIEDTKLLPNTYLKAFIELGEANVPTLPEESIVTDEEKTYIFISKGKKQEKDKTTNSTIMNYHFEKLEVRTGVSENGFVEVIFDIKNDKDFDYKTAQIVLKGANSLLSQMKNAAETGDEPHGH